MIFCSSITSDNYRLIYDWLKRNQPMIDFVLYIAFLSCLFLCSQTRFELFYFPEREKTYRTMIDLS